jgi:hypothetical protein
MVVSRRLPHKSVGTSPTRLKNLSGDSEVADVRYCQALSSHSGQVGKLLLMMFPPHQRVYVVGHLLDLHVRLKLGFPFDRDHVEIHGCGNHTQEFVQIATMLDLSIRVFHFSLSSLYVKTFQVHGKITEGIALSG